MFIRLLPEAESLALALKLACKGESKNRPCLSLICTKENRHQRYQTQKTENKGKSNELFNP